MVHLVSDSPQTNMRKMRHREVKAVALDHTASHSRKVKVLVHIFSSTGYPETNHITSIRVSQLQSFIYHIPLISDILFII